jgi:hypothetical protein
LLEKRLGCCHCRVDLSDARKYNFNAICGEFSVQLAPQRRHDQDRALPSCIFQNFHPALPRCERASRLLALTAILDPALQRAAIGLATADRFISSGAGENFAEGIVLRCCPDQFSTISR